jgi:anti-sigma regulatory factor (Ser/Thr protein kinase)
VTFAQTWDVSYDTDRKTATSSCQAEHQSVRQEFAPPRLVPPDLSACYPATLRQIFLAIGPESAKSAREFTKAALRDWQLDDLVAEAALIASELVTNAIRHGSCFVVEAGEQPKVELSWQRQASRVICMVTDRSAKPPVLGEADDDAESGRGLQVVAALAATWGWMMLGARSKAVWAALATLADS